MVVDICAHSFSFYPTFSLFYLYLHLCFINQNEILPSCLSCSCTVCHYQCFHAQQVAHVICSAGHITEYLRRGRKRCRGHGVVLQWKEEKFQTRIANVQCSKGPWCPRQVLLQEGGLCYLPDHCRWALHEAVCCQGSAPAHPQIATGEGP